MEYQLNALEHMISELLYPSNARLQKLTIEFLRRSRSAIKNEIEKIKRYFEIQVCSSQEKIKKLKHFIQLHLRAVTGIADRLDAFAWPTTAGVVSLAKQICTDVEELYHCLRLKFPLHFDINGNIPEAYTVAHQRLA